MQQKNRKQPPEGLFLNNDYLRLQQQMAARIKRMRRKPPTPPITPGRTLVEKAVEEVVDVEAIKEVAGIGRGLDEEVGAVVEARVELGAAEGTLVGAAEGALVGAAEGTLVEVGAAEGAEVGNSVASTILIRSV